MPQLRRRATNVLFRQWAQLYVGWLVGFSSPQRSVQSSHRSSLRFRFRRPSPSLCAGHSPGVAPLCDPIEARGVPKPSTNLGGDISVLCPPEISLALRLGLATRQWELAYKCTSL